MGKIQVPSIGRIVHYVRPGSADGVHKTAHAAAIITAVLPMYVGLAKDFKESFNTEIRQDGVSLCVLNPNGFYFNETVYQDEEGGPGTWHWPEYVEERETEA